MIDESTLHADAGRAMRAQRLMSDELLTEAFGALEAAYVDAWRKSDARDQDGRERLFVAVQIIGKVKDHLASIMVDGELASRALDEIERLGERRKRFGVI